MAGGITGLLLAKLGYKVLLIERGKHPRFALGESSTPVFSKKIRHLGTAYGVPELVELSSYDRIKASAEPLMVGPKELFQYYLHEPGQTRADLNGKYREIFVQTPEVDTQFLRSELDERLTQLAVKYGCTYLDKTTVTNVELETDKVTLTLQPEEGDKYDVEAKYLIDSTGHQSFLSEKLDLKLPDEEVDTPLRSRCVFTHFKTVGKMEDAVEVKDEKFDKRCTVDRRRATQHHCFEGGWYWFIPFDDGVTSVGINLDMDLYPYNDLGAEEEFWQITNKFPIIKNMLEGRETVNIPYIKTKRLQFRTRQAVGDRWAQLPAAACGADAWFSTGMGLTLINIDRLVTKIHKYFKDDALTRENFLDYEEALFKEWRGITTIVDGIYKSFRNWDAFKTFCFVCFMGVESYVHDGGVKRPEDMKSLMLNIGDKEFYDKHVMHLYNKVLEHYKTGEVSEMESEHMRNYILNEMKKYNHREYGETKHDGVHYRLEDTSKHYYSKTYQ